MGNVVCLHPYHHLHHFYDYDAAADDDSTVIT